MYDPEQILGSARELDNKFCAWAKMLILQKFCAMTRTRMEHLTAGTTLKFDSQDRDKLEAMN